MKTLVAIGLVTLALSLMILGQERLSSNTAKTYHSVIAAKRVVQSREQGHYPEFVELSIGDLNSPFTKDTVLALNAIVATSLATIKAFDKELPAIQKSVDSATAKLDTLSHQSKTALVDIKAAQSKLEASGELYNAAILSAMVSFVNDVDTEIREEKQELTFSACASGL